MMTPMSVAQYLEPETPPTSRRERCFRRPAQVQVRKWPCVTSIAGPYGETQLYER
jgi:hypothetical protein